MRRAAAILATGLVLAGCGSTDTGSGEGSGDPGRSSNSGSEGEQLSATDTAALAELRDQIAFRCDGDPAPNLQRSILAAERIGATQGPQTIVEIQQADRAENLGDFFDEMGKILGSCGATAEAARLQRID